MELTDDQLKEIEQHCADVLDCTHPQQWADGDRWWAGLVRSILLPEVLRGRTIEAAAQYVIKQKCTRESLDKLKAALSEELS